MCKEVTIKTYNGLSLISSVYPVCLKVFPLLGRVGLNVITNGTLSDSCLVDVSRAWLREIQEGKNLEPCGMNRRDET